MPRNLAALLLAALLSAPPAMAQDAPLPGSGEPWWPTLVGRTESCMAEAVTIAIRSGERDFRRLVDRAMQFCSGPLLDIAKGQGATTEQATAYLVAMARRQICIVANCVE